MKWCPRDDELEKLKIAKINIESIYAQYNPLRFKYWAMVVGPNLHICNWPHVKALHGDDRYYYELFALYGHKKELIYHRLNNLYKIAEKYDYSLDKPIVIDRPIVPNKFNDGYEAYEGHHRLAAQYFNNRKHVLCDLRTVCRQCTI